MLLSRIGLSLMLVAGVAVGQVFEVASVRSSGPNSVRGSDGGPGSRDPTRYTFERAGLAILIMIAYDVEEFQVSSKQPLDRDEFDLAAKLPLNTTKDEFRAMLRNLLIERFHIKLHIESREFPAFEMVLAKGGAKLGTEVNMRLASEEGFPQLAPGKSGLSARNSISDGHLLIRIRGQQQPLSRLAEVLRIGAQRPVVDKTGLSGRYDFALKFSSDLPNGASSGAAEPSAVPDLSAALREQLGLQLNEKKLPFDVVVVESFDRQPTGN
jgi:uncharacterized protein (TIGR03435 family)